MSKILKVLGLRRITDSQTAIEEENRRLRNALTGIMVTITNPNQPKDGLLPHILKASKKALAPRQILTRAP